MFSFKNLDSFPFSAPTLTVIIANKNRVGVRYDGSRSGKASPLYVGVAKYEEFLGGDSL